MVHLVLKNGARFRGEILRTAGRNLIISGHLIYPDGVVSYVENYFLCVEEIEKIFEITPYEEEILIYIEEFYGMQKKPTKWRVMFELPKLPKNIIKPRIFFEVYSPQKTIVEGVDLDLESNTCFVEAENAPVDGWITYRYKQKEYRRNLTIIHVTRVEGE